MWTRDTEFFQKRCRSSLFSAPCSRNQSKYEVFFFKTDLFIFILIVFWNGQPGSFSLSCDCWRRVSRRRLQTGSECLRGSSYPRKDLQKLAALLLEFSFLIFINLCSRFSLNIAAELSRASLKLPQFSFCHFCLLHRSVYDRKHRGCPECPGLKKPHWWYILKLLRFQL